MNGTRVERCGGVHPSVDPGFGERLSLVLVALRKESTSALLEGLTDGLAEQCRRRVDELAALPRIRRQALVAAAMGYRGDAPEAVRAAKQELSPCLWSEISRDLPAFLVNESPRPELPAAPVVRKLAARLARELSF